MLALTDKFVVMVDDFYMWCDVLHKCMVWLFRYVVKYEIELLEHFFSRISKVCWFAMFLGLHHCYTLAKILYCHWKFCQRALINALYFNMLLCVLSYYIIVFVSAIIHICMFYLRFEFFGIYIVMFKEILGTLLQVLIVFSILIFAFGVTFYAMLRNEVRQLVRYESLCLCTLWTLAVACRL